MNYFLPLFIVFILFQPLQTALAQEKSAPEQKEANPQELVYNKPKPKHWKANIEAGATIAQGNSKQESVYGKNNLDYKKGKWTDLFRSRLENTKINDTRSRERYDVNNQTRYNFRERNYQVAELEYISDRYGGYNYRTSETYGYGYDIIKREDLNLSSQISAGFRQYKLTNGHTHNSPLARLTGNLNWKIKKGISLQENLDVSIDKQTTIAKSDTALRIRIDSISHSFYLHLGYIIEHRTNTASADVKNTDSTFMTMIGYDF